jgi:hypothetical protein
MMRASNGAFLSRGGTFELMATNAELALRDTRSTVDAVLQLRDLVETFRHELKFANPSLRLAVVSFVGEHLDELIRIATWVIDDDEGETDFEKDLYGSTFPRNATELLCRAAVCDEDAMAVVVERALFAVTARDTPHPVAVQNIRDMLQAAQDSHPAALFDAVLRGVLADGAVVHAMVRQLSTSGKMGELLLSLVAASPDEWLDAGLVHAVVLQIPTALATADHTPFFTFLSEVLTWSASKPQYGNRAAMVPPAFAVNLAWVSPDATPSRTALAVDDEHRWRIVAAVADTVAQFPVDYATQLPLLHVGIAAAADSIDCGLESLAGRGSVTVGVSHLAAHVVALVALLSDAPGDSAAASPLCTSGSARSSSTASADGGARLGLTRLRLLDLGFAFARLSVVAADAVSHLIGAGFYQQLVDLTEGFPQNDDVARYIARACHAAAAPPARQLGPPGQLLHHLVCRTGCDILIRLQAWGQFPGTAPYAVSLDVCRALNDAIQGSGIPLREMLKGRADGTPDSTSSPPSMASSTGTEPPAAGARESPLLVPDASAEDEATVKVERSWLHFAEFGCPPLVRRLWGNVSLAALQNAAAADAVAGAEPVFNDRDDLLQNTAAMWSVTADNGVPIGAPPAKGVRVDATHLRQPRNMKLFLSSDDDDDEEDDDANFDDGVGEHWTHKNAVRNAERATLPPVVELDMVTDGKYTGFYDEELEEGEEQQDAAGPHDEDDAVTGGSSSDDDELLARVPLPPGEAAAVASDDDEGSSGHSPPKASATDGDGDGDVELGVGKGDGSYFI